MIEKPKRGHGWPKGKRRGPDKTPRKLRGDGRIKASTLTTPEERCCAVLATDSGLEPVFPFMRCTKPRSAGSEYCPEHGKNPRRWDRLRSLLLADWETRQWESATQEERDKSAAWKRRQQENWARGEAKRRARKGEVAPQDEPAFGSAQVLEAAKPAALPAPAPTPVDEKPWYEHLEEPVAPTPVHAPSEPAVIRRPAGSAKKERHAFASFADALKKLG